MLASWLCLQQVWDGVHGNFFLIFTVELQWLEHLWNHENMFETVVVRANECYS